jgi:hypothetical protein
MRTLIVIMAVAASLCFVTAVSAEDPITYTRFLVPLNVARAPGAYGSLWEVESWVHYAGDALAEIIPSPGICVITCPEGLSRAFFEPGWSPLPVFDFVGVPTWAESGVLYHVDSRYAQHITFASRIRDVSRAAETAGTDVPVIREDRLGPWPVQLLNVPIGVSSRNMLRIYALPEVADPEVDVRFYRNPEHSSFIDRSRILLRSQRVRLRTFPPHFGFLLQPSFAQIGALESLPELSGERAVWIEVAPVTPGLRVWAFVSVTNNETHQVTIITP